MISISHTKSTELGNSPCTACSKIHLPTTLIVNLTWCLKRTLTRIGFEHTLMDILRCHRHPQIDTWKRWNAGNSEETNHLQLLIISWRHFVHTFWEPRYIHAVNDLLSNQTSSFWSFDVLAQAFSRGLDSSRC